LFTLFSNIFYLTDIHCYEPNVDFFLTKNKLGLTIEASLNDSGLSINTNSFNISTIDEDLNE
jgi:hypothetical protein